MPVKAMAWQVPVFLIVSSLISAWGQITFSIPEEMPRGSLVGNVAQDLGLDVKRLKSGNARIYSGDGAEYMELQKERGALLIKERIDREQLCGKTTPCALHFQLILENPMEFYQINIEIIDINDNAPSFKNNEMRFEISESAIIGAAFVLDGAVDLDVGINGLRSYSLTPTDHFQLKSHSNAERNRNVEMVLQKALDREAQEQLTLLLTATDGGDPPMSGTAQIHITVLDNNDNAPVFTQPVYRLEVTENAPLNTVITTVSASDVDQGLNGKITYSISNSDDFIRNVFEIDQHTGAITLLGNIDYEKNKHFQIDINARDHGGLFTSCKVLVEVIDANDNKPVIGVMSMSNVIPESSKPGTVVTMINIQDPDSGPNGQVQCHVRDNIPFEIKSTSHNVITVVTMGLLDRETDASYNISIICIDEGVPSLSSTINLNLKISDVNDNVPVFSQSSYTAYVAENNDPGFSIFSVTARDADWSQNARVSYILEETVVNGVSASSYVSVNAESGAVHAVRSLDYEQIKELQLRVKAQDGGSPPLSSNVTVTLRVQDQNDNAPQVLYPVQTGTSVLAEMVPRSAELGYLVTKVVAVDVDSGQNAWLSYKLVKGTDRALFEVGLQNGEIRTIRPVSEKDGVKQKLTVVVEDNGQPSRSTTVNVNVVVADSFPEVLTEISDFTHEKDYNDSLTFYLILALAVVSFLFIVSLIAIISVKIHRWRQSRIFYQSNLPVIPYYPPLYADVDGTGTLRHVYNYDVCGTTDSRRSDMKFIKPCSQNILDTTEAVTLPHDEKEREAAGIYANQVSFLSGDGKFLMQFFQLIFSSAF